MTDNQPNQYPSSVDIIDQLSKIVGERDIIPEILLEKCKSIKDWALVIEHQRLLKESLHRDISIQAALLDYLLSTEHRFPETRQIELPVTQKVPYTSIIDPLTGLYNNRHFQIIVDAELKRAKQYSLPLTLLMLDLDNFGIYTALYGHEAGDIALIETALVLKKNSRAGDMLFRLEKNRFSAVLLNISREGAHRFGERLRESIERHHFKGEEKIPTKKLTISGGIAIYPDDGKNSHTLIQASEEALLTAKQSGKNRVLEYSTKRRRTPRIDIEIEAKYQIEGRRDIKSQLVYTKNISESGVLITGPSDLPLGGRIILSLKMPSGDILKAIGETVRVSRKEGVKNISIAIRFSDISPADIAILRNLIEQRLTKSR